MRISRYSIENDWINHPAGRPQYCTHAVRFKLHMGKPTHTVASLKANTYYECWSSALSDQHNGALLSVKTLILTHTLSSFCLSLGWFSGASPSFQPQLPWWSFFLFFIYSHTASTIVVLSFVCDWLILSAGDAVAVLPQSVTVRCCSCGVFTDSPWWVLSVSGWHTQFHHLRVFFRLVPHFVPQLSTLPSLTVIISIFSPVFSVSSPLSSSVNLFISPPTRLCLLCLTCTSVCIAVRASFSALWAKDAAAAKGGLR